MSAVVEYDAIPDEIWKRLLRGSSDPSDPAHLLVASTIDDLGHPDARLLALRGASREQCQLWFYSDFRAAKISHLHARPHMSLVTYDPRDGVQLRIRGHATIHHDDVTARHHWEQVDLHVRHAYASPTSPGQALLHNDPRMHEYREHRLRDAGTMNRNFAVIAVHVSAIDWLQVCGAGDRRAIVHANDWRVVPIAP